MKRRDMWLMPVTLNLSALAGLGWALLSDDGLSKALATLLLAAPLAIALYHTAKNPSR
jgi:hypothetical protein